MAMAMMVKTRLWLGGEVSEQQDLPLIRRLMARVKRCAARRPLLVCTDGLVSYIRAIGETFREPCTRAQVGGPEAAAVAACLDRASHQALRAAAGGRDRPSHCRRGHRHG